MEDKEYLIIGKAFMWNIEKHGYVDVSDDFDDIQNMVALYKESSEDLEKELDDNEKETRFFGEKLFKNKRKIIIYDVVEKKCITI